MRHARVRQQIGHASCGWTSPGSRSFAAALLISALVAATPGQAAGQGGGVVADPGELPVCYAHGTDAIGRAVTAVPSQDLDSTAALSDPNFAEGLAHYRRCFAPSFTFTLANRGVAGAQVPNPKTRTPKTDAALQWANFVNNAFRAPGYIYTQHHMGSIMSDVQGDEGSVVSYVIATHVFGPKSPRTGVSVVYGTYTDKVVRIDGSWRIAERTLDTFTSVAVPAGQ